VDLFDMAMAANQAAAWDDTVAGWFQICRDRPDYVSKGGEKAAVWLAEAVLQREGIASQRARQIARVERQLRIAWAVAIVWAVAFLSLRVYMAANGWLKVG
jgi:hypothetical protein